MAGTTTRRGYPYATGTDTPDIGYISRVLAEAIDADVHAIRTALDVVTNPSTGAGARLSAIENVLPYLARLTDIGTSLTPYSTTLQMQAAIAASAQQLSNQIAALTTEVGIRGNWQEPAQMLNTWTRPGAAGYGGLAIRRNRDRTTDLQGVATFPASSTPTTVDTFVCRFDGAMPGASVPVLMLQGGIPVKEASIGRSTGTDRGNLVVRGGVNPGTYMFIGRW